MAPTHLPGTAWLRWLKHRPLRLGLLTGIYLTAVMMVALLAANRLPTLEAYADLRNWICGSLFVLVALIPVATFWAGAVAPVHVGGHGLVGVHTGVLGSGPLF